MMLDIFKDSEKLQPVTLHKRGAIQGANRLHVNIGKKLPDCLIKVLIVWCNYPGELVAAKWKKALNNTHSGDITLCFQSLVEPFHWRHDSSHPPFI